MRTKPWISAFTIFILLVIAPEIVHAQGTNTFGNNQKQFAVDYSVIKDPARIGDTNYMSLIVRDKVTETRSSLNTVNASPQESNVSKDITSFESIKVLADDVIWDLKSNDIKKAQLHLSILNRQLSLENSTSLESVKVLIDDVTLALKNNNINNALIHLNLVKQQLTPSGISPMKQSALPQITNVQANHPPKVYNATVDLSYVTTTDCIILNLPYKTKG